MVTSLYALLARQERMTIHLSDQQGEALLRAASKSGYVTVVRDLLDAGVRADSLFGAAIIIAEFYGHNEIVALLREAAKRQQEARVHS